MDVNRIGSVNSAAPVQKAAQAAPTQQAPISSKPVVPKDVLELSAASSVSETIDVSAELRAQRLAQIQQQIADGTYETAEKLDAAVDRLLESLGSE